MQAQSRRIESELLITRTQMIALARTFNVKVTMSTIHRWANESGFPIVVGLDGKNLLYAKNEFVDFLRQRLKRIQEER